MEKKLSGSAKRKLKKEEDNRNAENLKYIPKIEIKNVFTPECFVKSASVNENNSASQDFSSPPALAYIYSPENEEPAASSNSDPDSAASATIEGSGDSGSPVLPPPEPLVESRSSPGSQRLYSLGIQHCGGPLRSGSGKRRFTEGLQLSRTGLPNILHQ
ncbi:hypothetical protein GOODEAATRI_025595 [Goodea atripinnis]|uniref:Uncharacterized protein n=1 Tax=Goodea atripinnis TaxID=208336 RepID=A0ABV0NN59_9TELE